MQEHLCKILGQTFFWGLTLFNFEGTHVSYEMGP